MDFGVKPELGTVHREKFFETNKSCNALHTNVVQQTLSDVVDFVWLTCTEIQKEAGLAVSEFWASLTHMLLMCPMLVIAKNTQMDSKILNMLVQKLAL